MYLVFGIFMILLGAYMIFLDLSKSRKCTAEAVGTVICVESKRVRSGRSRHTEYYPVVEFEADGKIIQEKADISANSPSKFPEGSALDIVYDPLDPETFMVKGRSLRSTLFYGILLILVGAGAIFLFTR